MAIWNFYLKVLMLLLACASICLYFMDIRLNNAKIFSVNIDVRYIGLTAIHLNHNLSSKEVVESEDKVDNFNIPSSRKNKKYHIDITNLTDEAKLMKTILVWHYKFGEKNLNFGFGHAPFVEADCEESRCLMTANKKLLPVYKFDAVIFHFRGLTRNMLPKYKSKYQRWIFYEMESSSYIDRSPEYLNGIFNWTMTYKQNSDIWSRYGRVIPVSPTEQKIRSSRSQNSRLPNWQTHPYNASRIYTEGKTKMAAWFVSNCRSKSRREIYVERLSKYIQIDTYGKCGNQSCSRRNSDFCYKMAEKNYKFYLSFENSLCVDYVTEKFFNILRYNIIPVVYGYNDYSKFAPPNSYIDVFNFKSIKGLAKYLIYLSNNDTAYNEYFKWKGKYDIFTQKFATALNFCDLCKKLHETNQKSKVYNHLNEWFITNKTCLTIQPTSWLDWLIPN